MRNLSRLNQNNWLSSDEEEQLQQTEIKILCLKWDRQVIYEKGLHPKFVIYNTIVCVIIQVSGSFIVYGYSTDWHPIVFYPELISMLMLSFQMLYELGQTSQVVTNNILFKLYKAVTALLGTIALVGAIAVKTPFNSIVLFLASTYPMSIIVFYFIGLTTNHSSVPDWLPRREEPKIPNGRFLSKEQQALEKKKNWWKFYVKNLWIAFTTATMLADIVSDIYYGIELIIHFRKTSLLLFLSGICMIVCCAADFVLMSLMLAFPGWVSYSAHVTAFLMEMPNLILTGLSIWKRQQIEDTRQISFGCEDQQDWGLAVFSLITTLLSALIHVAYIMDRLAVWSAVNTIQRF